LLAPPLFPVLKILTDYLNGNAACDPLVVPDLAPLTFD